MGIFGLGPPGRLFQQIPEGAVGPPGGPGKADLAGPAAAVVPGVPPRGHLRGLPGKRGRGQLGHRPSPVAGKAAAFHVLGEYGFGGAGPGHLLETALQEATLDLARDVTVRDVGPANKPTLYALQAEVRLRSSRTREALDALQALAGAYPEIGGLRELAGDLAILRALDRSGDSKEN